MCVFMSLCAQLTGNIVSASVSKKEGGSLHEKHDSEYNTYGCCRLRVYFSYKICVGYAVQADNEHANDRWN